LLGVEEAAHPAEQLVGLAAHRIFVAPALDREFGLGDLEGQAEMLSQALHIAFAERNQRIGATVAGALLAIVHHRHLYTVKAGSGSGNLLRAIRKRCRHAESRSLLPALPITSYTRDCPRPIAGREESPLAALPLRDWSGRRRACSYER